MKKLYKICYLILLGFITACGPNNDCNGTFYMSNTEKAFMAYVCNDSISITFNCNSDSTLNWTNVYEARYCLYDIVKEHDALEFGICIHEYERWIIQVYPKNDDLIDENVMRLDNIGLTTFKENNEFNLIICFSIIESNLNEYIYSTFKYYPLNIDNSILFFSENKTVEGYSYENVYTMVDNGKEFYDTLYYSPNYGLIKLITENGTYTFENLN